MIRVTVLYNLSAGESEDEFLQWRLSEHQTNNAAMPGVVRTDFSKIDDSWPADANPAYRFQTTVEWADRASFEAGFYADDVQSALQKNLAKLGDYRFFVSEVLISSGSS